MRKSTILLAVLLLIAGVIYIVFVNQSKNTKPKPKQESAVSPTSYEYTSNIQGYSLYLPNDYKVLATTPNETEFIYSGSKPGDSFAWIDNEPANGRTVEQVVQEVKAAQGGVLDIKTKNIIIDGEQAVVVSPLTGQNFIRRIIVIHNDTLYQMNFTPEDPQTGEFYKHMENLYKSVLDTFRFIK